MMLEIGVRFIDSVFFFDILRIPNIMSKSKRVELARLSYKTWNTAGLHS